MFQKKQIEQWLKDIDDELELAKKFRRPYHFEADPIVWLIVFSIFGSIIYSAYVLESGRWF